MRTIHYLLIVVFALFAYWQFNDPDPYLWVPIYLGVSIVGIMFLMQKYIPLIPLIGAIVCLIGLLMLSPEFISWIKEGMPTITGQMKAESPHVEFVREFLGYLLAGFGYLFYYRRSKAAKLS